MVVLECLKDWEGCVSEVCSYTSPDGNVCLVKVTSSDGVEGWGQVGNKDVDLSVELLHRRVVPAVQGLKMNDPWHLIDRILAFELNYKCMGVQLNKAISGFDTAVWDACGIKANKSVCQLMRDASRIEDRQSSSSSSSSSLNETGLCSFPVYASSISRSIPPVELAEKLHDIYKDLGVQAFKVKIGKRMQGMQSFPMDEWPGRTEEVIRTIRSRVGPDVLLAVDGNGGFRPQGEDVRRVCEVLKAHSVAFFEEPFPWFNYTALEEFRTSLGDSIAIAGGEQEFRMDVWEKGLPVDIYQPDVGYCGGASSAYRIARLARQAGARFIPHSPQGDFHLVFAWHLACAFSDESKDQIEVACVDDGYQQICFKPAAGHQVGCFDSPLFTPPLLIQQGRLTWACREDHPVVGWGVKPQPNWVRMAHPRTGISSSLKRSNL